MVLVLVCCCNKMFIAFNYHVLVTRWSLQAILMFLLNTVIAFNFTNGFVKKLLHLILIVLKQNDHCI